MVDKMIEIGWTKLNNIIQKSLFEWTQKRAYFRWLEAGSPVSYGKEFWFAAEQDWLEESQKPIELPQMSFPPISIPLDINVSPVCLDGCIDVPPIIFCSPPVIDHSCEFEEKCNV